MNEEFLKRRGKSITKKQPLSSEVKRSISMLIFILLIMIVLISIVYLLNSTQSGQKGHLVRQHQLQKEELINYSRQIVNKIIEAQSFAVLENHPQLQEMQPAENIIYLNTD